MSQTLFIDGAEGTTGLEIADRMANHPVFDIVTLDDAFRKDPDARREALNAADFAVLCLPDDAAREAAAMVEDGSNVRIVDASSAHRTTSGWIYGFPELIGREAVANARRVANPGCYPTGFLALLAPLVRANMLPRDWPYTVHAVSGYSGGGKSSIQRFEDDPDLAYRGYAYALGHKHLAEMQAKAGITHPPVFSPAVIPAFRGMVVEIPLPLEAMLAASKPAELHAELERFYEPNPLITVREGTPDEVVLRADAEPSDAMELWVCADPQGNTARLVASYDNLGKGASGAAVQSLNLMAGCDEMLGLRF